MLPRPRRSWTCTAHLSLSLRSSSSRPATITPRVSPLRRLRLPLRPRPLRALTVDRASSSIGFTGAKVTGSHDGSFSDFTGTIQLDPGNVTASAVEMTVQIASLHIEPERLSQHLLTPDFFDAAQFPTATFRSTSITEGGTGTVGDRPATHTITGELTMRGTTRTISFPAVVVVTPNEVTAQSEFTIQRRDFGIVYPGMPDDLIRDEVVLRFQMRAPRT
jgi:polyisoprenoid-binding protein YceI